MKKQITIIISLLIGTFSFAQNNINNILSEIERNNTGLIALRKNLDAKKIANKTGLYLANPEIGFNYLWGNPTAIGNRADFSITQSFDFPTAYGHRSGISDIKNEQLELEYDKQKRALLFKSRIICFDLIYINARKAQLLKRIEHAKSIAKSYKAKYDIGETNILEYNKSQLNLLNITKELEALEIEKEALDAGLARLNGGIPIPVSTDVSPLLEISTDFEQWYAMAEKNNSILNWLKQEIAVSQQQEKLSKALSLPKIQAGYMSEQVVGEQYQGLTIGLSLPMWGNKNTVKYARANTLAVESRIKDEKQQFYNQLKILFIKVNSMQKNVSDYRTNLNKFDNTALLEKALNKGEITLIEYMMELSIYYESVNNLLELDRDLNRTYAELIYYR